MLNLLWFFVGQLIGYGLVFGGFAIWDWLDDRKPAVSCPITVHVPAARHAVTVGYTIEIREKA